MDAQIPEIMKFMTQQSLYTIAFLRQQKKLRGVYWIEILKDYFGRKSLRF